MKTLPIGRTSKLTIIKNDFVLIQLNNENFNLQEEILRNFLCIKSIGFWGKQFPEMAFETVFNFSVFV